LDLSKEGDELSNELLQDNPLLLVDADHHCREPDEQCE
jgi:hypothetical protein